MGAHKTFILVTGLFTLSILLTGFWVRSNGKPYSTTILTIHKLISLAAAVVLGSAITQLNQAVGLSSAELTVAVVTSVLFVVSVLSGGIWSIEKEIPKVVLRLHQVTFPDCAFRRHNPVLSSNPRVVKSPVYLSFYQSRAADQGGFMGSVHSRHDRGASSGRGG